MKIESLIAEIFDESKHKTVDSLLECVHSIFEKTVQTSDDLRSDFIDPDFYDEIKRISSDDQVKLSFGPSLRDIRCVYCDDLDRKHVIKFKYLDKNKITVATVNLPPSEYQKSNFSKLEGIIKAFTDQVDSLQSYFAELDRIDEMCSVVDPAEPTFQHDYRKILLDTRVWLHINVTSEGLPANVSVVGNVAPWHQRLQDGLRKWDYDECITDNLLKIFDLPHFPLPAAPTAPLTPAPVAAPAAPPVDPPGAPTCGICLCGREAGAGPGGAPLPLCAGDKCGVYYHRACLYAWLVSCGSRAPLGLAGGACPNCGQNVFCTEKDN